MRNDSGRQVFGRPKRRADICVENARLQPQSRHNFSRRRIRKANVLLLRDLPLPRSLARIKRARLRSLRVPEGEVSPKM